MKELLEQDLNNDRHFVTALARGIQILRCFTQDQDELRASEIARLTGIPQPTVWRLCHTLIKLNYLQVSKRSDRLQLGIGALALGYSAFVRVETYGAFRPAMQSIAEKYGAAVSLAAPDGLRMIYLQRCRGTSTFGMELQIGSRVPILNTALGWAYLAALNADVRSGKIEQLAADNPIVWQKSESALTETLRRYGERGYVLNLGAFQTEINAVGIPVVSRDGNTTLALNCSGLASVLSPNMLEREIAPRLRDIADAIQMYFQSQAN